MDEPGNPLPSVVPPACEFIAKHSRDTRRFTVGERVCIRDWSGKKEVVTGTIADFNPRSSMAEVAYNETFPHRAARGISLTVGGPYLVSRDDIGKIAAPESDPGPAGRRRKGTRRRRRRSTRR
jgi:hypothetical protein